MHRCESACPPPCQPSLTPASLQPQLGNGTVTNAWEPTKALIDFASDNEDEYRAVQVGASGSAGKTGSHGLPHVYCLTNHPRNHPTHGAQNLLLRAGVVRS